MNEMEGLDALASRQQPAMMTWAAAARYAGNAKNSLGSYAERHYKFATTKDHVTCIGEIKVLFNERGGAGNYREAERWGGVVWSIPDKLSIEI